LYWQLRQTADCGFGMGSGTGSELPALARIELRKMNLAASWSDILKEF